MRVVASLYRNAIVLTIIVVITVIATVMVWNHHKYLHYESEFNELFLPLVNERNNEKIFYVTNVETDPKQYKNVLDISGGGLRNTRFIVYLLRLNNFYLDKNIDMMRMFNIFGGVSAGSIITGAIAYREIVLKNVVKNDKSSLIECMKKFKYTDAQITKCIELILHDSRELNYGTLILQWIFYEFISLKDILFNVSVFDRITTLNGFLHPHLSSSDKHAYLKRYFDFDIKSISKPRRFITCAIKIENENNIISNGTPNEIILFANTSLEMNNPNVVKYNNTITNMADIIHISTHTIGFYPVCLQYPFAWDATAYMNNISTLVIPLFLNHSANMKLNYFSLSDIKNLTYENEGSLWWLKNVVPLVRIQTKYDMNLIQYVQQNKYHNVVIDSGATSTAFDKSTDEMLNDIRLGSDVSINDSVNFIRAEMLDATHAFFDKM